MTRLPCRYPARLCEDGVMVDQPASPPSAAPAAAPALVPVEVAQARLFATAPRVPVETIAIDRAAGRWAAANVVARRTQPAADLSAMDGYAIRFADLPGPWRIVGESAAGRPLQAPLAAGQSARIFTGAAMPAGSDCVLIQEEATQNGDLLVLSGEGPRGVGGNVRRRGLDFSEGDTLIAAGDRITPARLAVAITGGVDAIDVHRTIRVAIAATGDELVAPGTPLSPLSLPEGNSAMLAAMLADLPVEIIRLGILPDDMAALVASFAAVDADLLVTTGGASVGDHDLVRPALEAAGGVIDFWRIALRPGKPMMAGSLGSARVLGLPGNPVSAFVTAILFVRPLVAHLAGARDPLPRTSHALLGEELPANGLRTDYLRAVIDDGRVFASTIQDSSMLLTLARSTCLIVRPAGAPSACAGDSAEILVIA